MTPETGALSPRSAVSAHYIHWTPVIAGALVAAALSFILLTFGAAVGLGVASTAPTWRDASVALWILSGIYLILQALLSFGVGGYVSGRMRSPLGAGEATEVENRDGFHGLAVWSLAVVMGALIAALIGGAALSGRTTAGTSAHTSAAEPLLSYELDRLYRAPRRSPNVDLSSERAEAGRILLTASGHDGMSTDDRAYLIQQVAATTGIGPVDAERRVDNVIVNSRAAIARSRRSTIILAFSVAAALLLAAIAAWVGACTGGRHRDGAPLPDWMATRDLRVNQRRAVP